MRLNGRQARFLMGVIACWSAGRIYMLAPGQPDAVRSLPAFFAPIANGGGPPSLAELPAAAVAPVFVPAPSPSLGAPARPLAAPIFHSDWRRGPNAARLALILLGGGEVMSAEEALRRATFAYAPGERHDEAAKSQPIPAPAPLFPVERSHGSRIEAQAYLFWRPGGGPSSLAEHGELGGSQVAARIAVPIGHGLAVAARAYAPLEHRGAEGAVGLDWHPLASVPLRLSVERRQRFDALGRSAWSAYVAGGFYKGGGPGTAQFDGYAQAGVVGIHRRDGFIDGALRLGYRLPVQKVPIVVGAGLWGATQPQVSRIDAGPRLSVVLPMQGHSLTLAAEGRFRMAGQAAPGSGAALTLAADF